MKQHSLEKNGLSMTQAQTISNLCYQKALEITNTLNNVNNCSKKIGSDTIVKAKRISDNVVELLNRKAKYSACQAFLMENIKAKQELIDSLDKLKPVIDFECPKQPKYVDYKIIDEVTEEYGWEQLKVSELNEYYEVEAFAAHIGNYFHKNGILDKLRTELPNIPDVEWIELEKDKKTMVTIDVHHTTEQLLEIHEELAKLHRKYSQRVNYFKAKVKNIVTIENTRIAKENSDNFNKTNHENKILEQEYNTALTEYNSKVFEINNLWNIDIQNKKLEYANYKIKVDPRFQTVIDEFKDIDK